MSILLWVLFLPLLGSLILAFIPSWNYKWIRSTALIFSVLTFLVSLLLWIYFDNSTAKFQFMSTLSLVTPIKNFLIATSKETNLAFSYSFFSTNFSILNFTIGVDGISLFFIILTTFLIPVCILVGWSSIQIYVKEYCIFFLLLECLLIAVFSVLDLLLFYIFFESVLIPMFLIIGVWGSRERKIKAAYQFFFIYTFWFCFNVISYFINIFSNRKL